MSRRFTFVAVIFALALLGSGPAASQSPSPEARQAARELVATMRLADQFKAIFPLILQQLRPAIVQGRPEVERDLNAVMPILVELIEKRSSEMIDATAGVYERHFSVEEMRQLTAFYREPVGQKLLEKLPLITKEALTVGQKFGQVVAAELQARIVEELRKRGHKI